MTASAPKISEIKPGWLASFKVYLEPATLRMLSLGFSAGLPLLLVLGTLSFWLREAGIDRTTIGYLSWVGLAYAFKWIWAPLVDRMPIPLLTTWLGRRRSWLPLPLKPLLLPNSIFDQTNRFWRPMDLASATGRHIKVGNK